MSRHPAPAHPVPTGRQWRSLLEDPSRVAAAYPSLAPALAEPLGRRHVLKLMAASVALGGLAGCDPVPDGVLIPAVVAPPGIIPSVPNAYATASLADGGPALGIVVTHVDGRPIKVEGNPGHPASLGATDAAAQALILDFYDPDRSASLQRAGEPVDRQRLLAELSQLRQTLAADHGAGLRILTGTVWSPTTARLLDAVVERYPQARWHAWEATGRDAVRQGGMLAYGRPVDVLPHLARADVLLALDSDLLSGAPGHVRHARDFAARRNPTRAQPNRLYAIEPTPTLTGVAADHRFIAGPAELHAAVMGLAARLLTNESPSGGPPWLDAIAEDLRGARGRAFIHAGPQLPAEAQALVLAMNEALGGRGQTFDLIAPPEHAPGPQQPGMDALLDDMRAGRVSTLLVLDSDPVFTQPGFAAALRRVARSIATAPSMNDTGAASTWFIPQAHAFEAWSDARAYDGTAAILQPMAQPLYQGIAPTELLSLLLGSDAEAPLDAVQRTWADQLGDAAAWRAALADGVVPNTAQAPLDVALRPQAAQAQPPAPASAPLTVLLRPDPHLGDGRAANNAWLQELPRPLTKLVWDNPLLIAPALAQRMGLANGAEVELTAGSTRLVLPVWIMPGQAEDVVVALTGYGRRVVGEVGRGTGFDVNPLRGAAGPVALHPTGRQRPLATTDHHDALDASAEELAGGIVRHGTLAAFTQNPHFLQGDAGARDLYNRAPGGTVAWGMSVDLNACIGCNACVVACMAENNVPVVGKANVMHEREMHWLRIDRYYEGPAEDPQTLLQPMLCMHCEDAPCEVVCPFGATVHDDEGLNVMVYNRCGGTRFCSNNCPYKVRRFNYGAYAREEHRPPPARNPDVTVRARGVMEKCTFCLQRIAAARIAHDRDGVPEQAVTACQAACPTQAFSFGNLNDAASAVVQRKHSPLDYVLLPEQNTHPRVTYEARILNRNPAITA